MKNTLLFKNALRSLFWCFALMLLLMPGKGWGQTPYPMSGGNYTEAFTNIANTTNWPNNFNGTDSAEWKSVAINATGTIGDGVKTSVSTATFTTTTSSGVQRGTANIQMLSTSTNNSCAIDLLLDFTGRNAGTVSFDVATVFNSTGNRDSKLKLFWSTDGTTFTELTGTNLPFTARNNVALSASITTIALPSAFNNSSTARLRFYEYSTTLGGSSPSGSQPKISIDNISITSTPVASGPEINIQGNNVSIADGATPASLTNDTDFGTVATSTDVTKTYTIENTGSADLILTAPYVQKTLGIPEFTITQPLVTTIPAGSSTTFSVTFNSATAGTFDEGIEVLSNDTDEGVYDFDIKAIAEAPMPNITVTGTTANGSSCINTAATTQTYTITNAGIAAENVVVSSDDSQFVVSELSSTSIGATNGTATYDVTFTPTSAGAQTATIRVFYDTTTLATTSSLTGTGLATVAGAVSSSAATLVSTTTATLNGNVTALGTCPATTEKGFVYAVTAANSDPLVGGSGVTATNVSGLATGAYALAITDLTLGTDYTYKAYVYDGTIYTYGIATAFTTLIGVPVATAATNIGSTSFDANWGVVAGANDGYLLDVSESATFGIGGVAINEGFESVTFPPAGWITTNWTRSTVSGDISSGIAAAVGIPNNGTLTTSSVSNPSSMTFYIGRSSNTTAKTLTIEVSTTSQTTGFITVATYDHDNVPSSSYDQYSVDLSAYSSNSTVYIRFNKASSTTSPWRLDDVVINNFAPSFVSGYDAKPIAGQSTVTSTVTGLAPNTIHYYRVRAVNGSDVSANSNVITVMPVSCVWDGLAWSNTTGPDANTEAVIEGDYSTATNGTFTAKKVTVNSGSLTVNTGTNLTIQNELINNLTAADVVVANNANLIQVNAIANTGTITVNRNSASLMRQDYTLWSSPVAGQQLQAFSPATLANRFYTYSPSSNLYVAEPATNTFATGTGYLIRMPNTHPTTPTVWNGTFTGVPNNGDVNLTVANATFNAIGNPYPSTIDADTFITVNGITEALYFWRKTNNTATTSYATYTLAGGAGTGSNTGDPLGLVPNGTIQVGQGFIAKSTSATLSFTNAMKVADNANQFLRTNTVERNRIWLNLTNTAGLFSQTMVAYMTDATQGIDAAIDGRFFNDSPTALTSIINTEEFAIQGRALPFADSDVVALGFKSELAGNYSIAIDHVDGLFTDGQPIYLKDNLMNATHNLNAGSYAFATAAGVFNNRFEIVYQNQLSVALPTFNENSVVVYKNSGAIHINAGTTTINNVKLFDISGRLVAEKSNVNATATTVDGSQLGTQVLIVQITSDTQIKVSKKLVN